MLFSAKRRTGREAALRLYAVAAEAARRPALFTAYGVPDTLSGRFDMVVLHLFPLIYRLMHQPGDAPELARLVSECFVEEMDSAFRDLGVADTRVPKRMKVAFRSFAGRIEAYSAALAEGPDALSAAIERNVFPDGAGADAVRGLAAYGIRAVEAVRAEPLAALARGDLVYPPLDAEELP